MRRRRKQYRKSFVHYALPLVLSLGIAAGMTMGVNSLVSSSIVGKQQGNLLLSFDVQEPGIFLIQDQKRTELPVGYKAEVRDGEGIETTTPELLILTLPSGEIVKLGANTRMTLQKQSDLVIDIDKGSLWIRSQEDRPLRILGDFLHVRVPKGEWTFLDEGKVETLAIVEGQADVTIQDGKETVHETTLQGGSMLMMTKGIIQTIRSNPGTTVTAPIGADMMQSRWFVLNRGVSEEGSPAISGVKDNSDVTTAESLDQVPVPSEPPANEEKKAEVTSTNTTSVCRVTAPTDGKITKQNDVLKGTAPEGTARVQVNDYVLKKYQAGDVTWTYYLDGAKGGNMTLGTNTFTVTCFDDAGTVLGEEQITIAYLPG